MRRLILLRHAHSAWDNPHLGDFERVLDERGRDTAPLMGRYLAQERLVPDRVIVSGARRTRQTWDLVAPKLPHVSDVHYDKRIYEAPWQVLLGVVRENLDEAESLMLVGHNPGLQSLALHLARRDATASRRRLETKYPTLGLAVLDFLFLDWADVMPDTGIIERFETPKTIGAHELDD